MDQERFDHLARGLASDISRRGMVRQLTGAALGGVLVAVGGSAAGAKKKKHSHGKGNGNSTKPDKVAVCHYDAEAQTWVAITVSQAGWDNGHSKHKKDFQQADKNGCCLGSDCAGLSDACNKGTCVVDEKRVGACQAAPTPGAVCGASNLCVSRRICQADGTCGGGGGVKPCAVRECNTVQCNPNTGECEYTPTPGAPCGTGGTCDDKGACAECTTCGDNCPGSAENNPAKTLAFAPSSDADFCLVIVDLTGFAGCTSYTAEYWSAINTSGSRAKNNGNVTLDPTDLSGFSRTTLGTYAKGGAVDIRFVGAASDYQWVDC
jgi:hypothetical protein